MMKKKFLSVLLIGIFCLSLTACGGGSVKTSQEDSSFEKKMLNIEDDKAADSGEEAEDDEALTGVLTEDSYTNEYFGLKLNKAEGGKIKSLMDPGTDLMPLSETYTEGIGSISIESRDADGNAYVSMNVSALSSKEQGKDGEVLAMEQFELEQSLNTAMDYEAECSFETINIAGEEYPAYVEISDSEEGRKKAATIYIVKGEFKNVITVYAPEDRFDEMLQLIEKN